jgi:uncharacterized protein YcfL
MKYLNLLLTTFLIFSCSSSNEKILKEASELHEQSLNIEKEVLSKFEELEQTKNSINIQGRALTEEEIKFTREVDLLGLSLNYWLENHPQVPQIDQQKNEKPSSVKFTPQDILLIQKEFNDSISAIRVRVNALKIPS